ncbi:lipoate protein ligase C-terminal domain-containing protein, partial [Yanshouia hominis]
ENGRITRADFYGDFLSLRPLDELSRALCGCAFRREDVEAVLRRFEPREYFGGITAEEVLATIFDAAGTPESTL